MATKVRSRSGKMYTYAIMAARAEYNPARDLAIATQLL